MTCTPTPDAYLNAALHELDPTFRRVTLENPKLQDLTRDLGFHTWPLGALSSPGDGP